jgi:hypothetical protein
MNGMTNQKINPLRLIIKALVLYAIANVLFAFFEPPVGRLTIYNWLVPGRLRFPYERQENISKGYNISLFQDLNAAFSAHVISSGSKPADEYRVVLVGDSSVWGFALNSTDTLTSKLNELNLRACDGRRMRFYNLSYPWTFVFKDLLVLERSKEYEPDMVLWLFTMHALTASGNNIDSFFRGPLIADAKRLQTEYKLADFTSRLSVQSFWDKTIIGQRKKLKANVIFQMYGFLWAATGVDHHLQPWQPWKDTLAGGQAYRNYESLEEWPQLKKKLMLDVFHAGHTMLDGIPVVFINEPIYAASGPNSDIRYNKFYPRWAYDNYRSYLSAWMAEKKYSYLDMWQVVPPEDFSDFPFHLYPKGEQVLAENIAPGIFDYSCEQK